MEGQLFGAGFGTPFIVSQESAPTSKVTLTNLNSSHTSTTNKSSTANVDEPMLDWKSLEFLGLVEEYVSAVIKGEKIPASSAGAAAAGASVTTTTAGHFAASTSHSDSFAGYDAAAAAVLSDAAAAALPHVRYATSSGTYPEVMFSSAARPATSSASGLDAATSAASASAASQKTPSTLFVMKNVGPNGAVTSDMGAMMAAPLGTATSVGSLGTAMAPIGSLGGVASLGDLATFFPYGTTLPIGTTLIASPIGVDGSQTLQNVAFAVRDDMSIIQPTYLTQAPIQAISANGQSNVEFSVSNDMNYHVDYIVNDEFSRDGLSPNDSFESSSLSLSVGDPSPSSEDCVNGGVATAIGGVSSSGDNLNDVIILSQTQPHSLVGSSSSSSGALLGSTSSSPNIVGLPAGAMGLVQSSGSPSPLTMVDVNSFVHPSSNGDPSIFNRVVPNSMKQPVQQRRQPPQQQQGFQSKVAQQQQLLQQRQGSSTVVNQSPTNLVTKTMHSGNGGLLQQHQQQAISMQGGVHHGIQQPSMSGGGGGGGGGMDAKPKSRRNQTKQIPEESLPFPCDVCGRRFVSMHSVKRHMAIHDLDRPWKCEVCHKCFKQQAHLYSHKFTHTGSKPFECTMCHKSFNVKSNLHRHEKEVCKVPLESRTPTRSK